MDMVAQYWVSREADAPRYVGSVDFLLSDRSVYMAGQNIVVDGGWGIW